MESLPNDLPTATFREINPPPAPAKKPFRYEPQRFKSLKGALFGTSSLVQISHYA